VGLADVGALEAAGADQVTLWLPEDLPLEELVREKERIAAELL
jgi:phospholipase/lecithinase/hemolysin